MSFTGFLRKGLSVLPGALAAWLFIALLSGFPAQAQTGQPQPGLDRLTAAAATRLTEPSLVDRALRQDGLVRVIVEFAAPPLPPGIASASAAGDRALIDAIHRIQDRILGRVLSPDTPGWTETAPVAPNFDPSLHRMRYSPLFALNADAALLQALAADPEVTRIHIDHAEPPALAQTLPLIGLPAAIAAGGTGNGQVIAVIDSGALVGHEQLTARLVEGACFGTNVAVQGVRSLCPGGVIRATTLASGTDCTDPAWRGCGHGTHVASTAAGFIANPRAGVPPHGVARDARIMTVNVFSLFPANRCGPMSTGQTHCVLAYISDQIAALEHVYSRRGARNLAAVNMSLGGGRHFAPCETEARRSIVRLLTDAGIAVVVAAGNDGYNDSVNAPSCIPEAIAVGNTTKADQRRASSNWSPLVDLAAPGTDVYAAHVDGRATNAYRSLSGTSMAAPHVSGAIAVIRSAMPDAPLDQILAALVETGTPITSARTTLPRINVDRALAQIAATTTTVLTGPTDAVLNQTVTFRAVVTSGSGTPRGRVIFRRDGTTMGAVLMNAQGAAALATGSLPVGTHRITAEYEGNADFPPSTSAVLTIVVRQDDGPRPPPNDDFANRIAIMTPGSVTGTNVGATAEPGEPEVLGRNDRRSVWWSFTPARDGQLTIDTSGSGFDTVLAVFAGTTLAGLRRLAENDDAPGLGNRSRVQIDARAGTAYQILVAGSGSGGGASGAIALNLALADAGPVATQTTLTGPASARAGDNLTWQATVTADVGGIPAGLVSFRSDGAEFGRAALNASGVATLASRDLPVGGQAITAHYLGATGFSPSTSTARNLSVTPLNIGFEGGGALFALTAECDPVFGRGPLALSIRYSPSELNGLPSGVSLIWRTGSEHLALWGPMAPSANFFGAAGRQTWSRFVFYATRPLVRVVQRQTVAPDGAPHLAQAQEIILRLRAQNLGNQPGCAGTIAATLRRN